MVASSLVLSASWVVHAEALCRSSLDCGLNGECDTKSGACFCDPGWTAANCTKLDFAPAAWGPSRQAFMKNQSSWGGNAVRGPDGLFHLFFSELKQDGLHQYQLNSQATHAVSRTLLGPYEKVEVIRAPLSHNVQPQIGTDGAVYIVMINGVAGAKEPHGPLMLGRAESPNSTWEWIVPKMFYENGTRMVYPDEKVDNPTAILRGDGSVLMMVRGSVLYSAPSWRGPYTRISEDALGCGTGKKECSVEDPFIWQSPRGLHMIAHDHEPFDFHKQATAYAFTSDVSGLSGWVFSHWPAAEARNITFDDGTQHTFCSQQRPQLHFSEPASDGVQLGHPIAMFTGVQHGALTEKTGECGINNQNSSEYNPYFDYSFTMAQPLMGATPRAFVV